MICGERLASCVCEEPDTHDVHVCPCGGSWTIEDGHPVPQTWPATGEPVSLESMGRLLEAFIEGGLL